MRSALVQIGAGREIAMSFFYDATSARVFGLALRILRDSEAAEETTLDVYCQVWRQSGRYDPRKGTVMAWLMNLARSRAIDHFRSRARRTENEFALDAEAEPESDSISPEQGSMESERARQVQRALKTLPAAQRRALEAAFFEGLSHSEVAEKLGEPLGTVKTRIRAGLAALRAAMAESGESLA